MGQISRCRCKRVRRGHKRPNQAVPPLTNRLVCSSMHVGHMHEYQSMGEASDAKASATLPQCSSEGHEGVTALAAWSCPVSHCFNSRHRCCQEHTQCECNFIELCYQQLIITYRGCERLVASNTSHAAVTPLPASLLTSCCSCSSRTAVTAVTPQDAAAAPRSDNYHAAAAE